jgi:hypothetical protein
MGGSNPNRMELLHGFNAERITIKTDNDYESLAATTQQSVVPHESGASSNH